MIITVANPSEGVGKTTLAMHLADDLSGDGGGVILMDADPRANAVRWAQRRIQALRAKRFHIRQPARTHVRADLQDLAQRAAYLVIDTPSRLSPITQLALLLADVVLVPWSPEACAPTRAIDLAGMIAQARQTRADLQVVRVMNRCREGTFTASSDRHALSQETLPWLASEIYERLAFAHCGANGLLVREFAPGSAPAEEIVRLAQAVRGFAR